jgi:RHS repeat-associated protein
VVATYAMDPHNMPRILSITASGPGGALWNSGNYSYDGQGNISAIGNSSFTYDGISRIVSAYVQTDPNVSSSAFAASNQYFCYDSFGNLLGMLGSSDCSNPNLQTYSSSNQLKAGTYNTRGNLTQWNGAAYAYEGDQSQLQHFQSGQEQWFFMYDADDERVWQVGFGIPGLTGQLARWTLRGLDGKVRREFNVPSYQWGIWNTPPSQGGAISWWRDSIYRANVLLANYLSNGFQRHIDADHLGSVRLTTNLGGNQDGYHVYFPFGQEAITGGEVPVERVKFAGNERYLAEASGNFLLDYMHARDASPFLGRFLSPDSKPITPRHLLNPQKLNGYSYVLNNPVNLFDPNGKEELTIQLRAYIPQFSVFGFKGDDRGPTTSPAVTSRTEITFTIQTDRSKLPPGSSPLVDSSPGKAGRSENLFTDRKATQTKGNPVITSAKYDANGNAVVTINQESKNPLTPELLTPPIRSDVTITVPPDASSITTSGTYSASPGFELNVFGEGGDATNIAIQTPSDNSFLFAIGLYETNTITTFTPLQFTPM